MGVAGAEAREPQKAAVLQGWWGVGRQSDQHGRNTGYREQGEVLHGRGRCKRAVVAQMLSHPRHWGARKTAGPKNGLASWGEAIRRPEGPEWAQGLPWGSSG